MAEWYPGKLIEKITKQGILKGLAGPRTQESEFPFVEKGSRLCGNDLERWLMDRGLSLFDAKDIVIGISDFKSTTLAFDDKGRIVDYDQYYQEPEFIRPHSRAIWDRLQRQARAGIIRSPETVLIFKNVVPDCLEYYGLVSPYV
jgi:hypothetical protein